MYVLPSSNREWTLGRGGSARMRSATKVVLKTEPFQTVPTSNVTMMPSASFTTAMTLPRNTASDSNRAFSGVRPPSHKEASARPGSSSGPRPSSAAISSAPPARRNPHCHHVRSIGTPAIRPSRALSGFTPRKGVVRLDEAQECSSAGRAAVSKTAGRGFEPLHSCQIHPPRWWNWQTRRLEGAVPVRAYEFESHPRHQHSHCIAPRSPGRDVYPAAPTPAVVETAARNRDNRSPGPRSQVVRQGSAKPLSSVRFRPWPPTPQDFER